MGDPLRFCKCSRTLTHSLALSLLVISHILLSPFFFKKKNRAHPASFASLICANAHCSRHVVCVLVPSHLSVLCSDPLCHRPGVQYSTVQYRPVGDQKEGQKGERTVQVRKNQDNVRWVIPVQILSHPLPHTPHTLSLALSLFFSLGSPIFVGFFLFRMHSRAGYIVHLGMYAHPVKV